MPELDQVSGEGKAGLRPTAEAATAFLERKIGQKNLRHGSLNVGVHLSGIDEIRILNFEKIILVGATEGLLPGAASESSFLTDQMLEYLGEIGQAAIATTEQSKVLGSNLIALLADKTPVITRSRGAMIGKLDNIPSRFLNLDSLKEKLVTVSSMNELIRQNSEFPIVSATNIKLVENATSAEEPKNGQKLIAEALKVYREPTTSGYFGIIDNFSENLSISQKFLSPTAIEGFIDCEYKFFVTKILGIYTADRGDKLDDWRAKDFGNLIHNSMEAFLNDLAATNELPDGDSAFSQDQIDLYFSKYLQEGLSDFYAKGHDGWRAGFEAHMTRVERNLRDFFKNEFSQVRSEDKLGVYASELGFGQGPDVNDRVTLDVPGRDPIQLVGRIDLLDLSADGKKAGVLDFKSGAYSSKVEAGLGRKMMGGPNRGLVMRTKVQDLVYSIAVRKRYKNLDSVNVHFAYIADGNATKFVKAAWADQAETKLAEIVEGIYLAEDNGKFRVTHNAAITKETLCDVCRRLGWVAEQLRLAGKISGSADEDGSDD